MANNNFINSLKRSVKQDLPSFNAHKLMMPEIRLKEFEKTNPDNNTIKSAVLLLLFEKNNQLYLIFIKRQKYDGIHSGQIAFPGGKFENNDKTLTTTALRETYEEIGISPSQIEIIGQLSELFIPPSNFLVQPFIGYTKQIPDYKINDYEVEVVFEVSINEIIYANPINNVEFELFNNQTIKAPCYIFENHKIWGATSMILNELITIIKTFTLNNN